ncbi:MAG: DUF354 domain-containing protein [Bacteroidales bacterium]|nr:DUF354 domain-containing protein [Bacteroidales bacterium]
MNILIDINHPAHVHLFKNFAWEMQVKGHHLLFTTRNKEIAHLLLKNYGFNFISFGKHYKKPLGKIWGILKFDIKLWLTALKFKPDVFVSMGSIYASHASKLIGKPHILFQDTENAKFQHKLSIPFADVVINPTCFELEFKNTQIFYEGYHELAYLHPCRFTPDAAILNELGIAPNEKYVIMRFVSWTANHDVGHKGLTIETKIKAAQAFSKHARVLITSEGNLPDELKPYQIKIPIERIHHAMAFASLLYGESATMASECAVLGVPSIFLDNDGRGYTNEQQKEFGLVHNYSESAEDQAASIERVLKYWPTQALKKNTKTSRSRCLNEK